MALAFPVAVLSAQAPGYQVISGPFSVQFQVPLDWRQVPAPDLDASALASPKMDQAVVVLALTESNEPLGLEDGSSLGFLRVLLALQTVLRPPEGATDVGPLRRPAPVLVPGATAAVCASIRYADAKGEATVEYFVGAANGSDGYVMLLEVSAASDDVNPSLTRTIVDSFALTGAPAGDASPGRPAPSSCLAR